MTNGWMDECVDGVLNGQIERQMDGCTCTFTCNYRVVVNIVRKLFPPFFHL